MTLEAATNALQRLYPQFHVADHAGWPKVYEKAQKGAPDALKSVGDDGEPAKNPVCKAILAFIAGGKKGIDIRKNFEGATYGWPGDAVDGGMQVLLVAGLIRAQDEKGQTIDPKDLERKVIGKTMFKVESATVSAAQRIQIRKVLQKVGLSAKQGEELAYVPQFLVSAQELANRAGGDALAQHGQKRRGWKKSASPQATSSCWPSTTSATNSATRLMPGRIWPNASRNAFPPGAPSSACSPTPLASQAQTYWWRKSRTSNSNASCWKNPIPSRRW